MNPFLVDYNIIVLLKFPDLLVEINVATGSCQSTYPHHLGHFFHGSHESCRLNKKPQYS